MAIDVERILSDFQATEQRKETEKKEKEAERVRRERDRRRLNAGKVEEHLRTVIQPIFEDVQKKVRKAGHLCDVETISTRDPDLAEQEQTFAVGLKMTIHRNGMSYPAWMQYAGESDGLTLILTQCHGNGARETRGEPMPLMSYGPVHVEREVDTFLKTVFPSR